MGFYELINAVKMRLSKQMTLNAEVLSTLSAKSWAFSGLVLAVCEVMGGHCSKLIMQRLTEVTDD